MSEEKTNDDMWRLELPLFDSDGDISEDTQNWIIKYTGDPWAWLEFCVSCWDQRYGRINRYETDTEKGLEFVTGGWSSNELVISVMMKNHLMRFLCWESSTRGGKHCFQREKIE